VKRWFPSPAPGSQQFAEALRDGTLGAPGARERLLGLAKDTTQPAIARASALSRLDRVPHATALEDLRRLLRDPDPLVRRAAAGAYAGAPDETLPDLLPLLDDLIRDVRLEAAFALAHLPPQDLSDEARRWRDRGIDEYIASQRSNADRPEAHHNLGVLFMRLGRATEAAAALEQALAVDPTFVPAAVTLSDLYRATGRDAEGEPVLRAMIERRPAEPAPHHALGLRLIRNGRPREALAELRTAADLGSADPRNGYVYAIAVADTGNRMRALQLLRQVLADHPYHRDSLYAAATFERDGGNFEAARRYAEQLVALEPDNTDLRSLLRQLEQQ
jgi:tetratricopeptide (TPR) repeat protein